MLAVQNVGAFVGASSELIFLFESNGVDEAAGKALIAAGIRTVPEFGAFVATATELRETLKAECGLDGAAGLQAKAKVAKFVVAWTNAQKRSEKQAEVDVENAVRNVPKILQTGDFGGMRDAYEKKYKTLEEDQDLPPIRLGNVSNCKLDVAKAHF